MESTVAAALTRWRDADLVDDDQVSAIEAYEADLEPADAPAPTAEVTDAPPSVQTPPVPAVPVPALAGGHGNLLVEGLAYVGAALALGAAMLIFGDLWDDLGPFGRISLAGVATVIVSGASVALRDHLEGPLHRLSTLLAALGVVGLALTVGVTLFELTDVTREWIAAIAGFIGFGAAVPLERTRPSWPVTLAMGAGLLTGVFGLEGAVDLMDNGSVAGITLMGLGLAWAALGWGGWLRPRSAFEVTGLVAGGMGVQVLAVEGPEVFALVIGLLIAFATLAVGLREERMPPSVLGGIGITAFAPQLVNKVFEDSIGAPLALLVGGLSLITVAVTILRRRGAA